MCRSHLCQQPGCAQFAQPESKQFRRRVSRVFEVTLFHQPPDHGPVLVALRFFGAHQILDSHQVHRFTRDRQGRSPGPQQFEAVDAAQRSHQIDSQAFDIRPPAAEMDCVAAPQKRWVKARDGNHGGFESIQCRFEMGQVPGICQDHQMQVAAKLRGAVEHARLAAHEQRSRATLPDRRKGFEYRAPAQAILPARDRYPTVSWTRGSAGRG